MALIYRLSADLNPLHADPDVAKAAGFPRPILHGLGTFGVVGHALLKSVCNYDPNKFTTMSGRKVDLATFVGSSSGEIALPSAPDPNRE